MSWRVLPFLGISLRLQLGRDLQQAGRHHVIRHIMGKRPGPLRHRPELRCGRSKRSRRHSWRTHIAGTGGGPARLKRWTGLLAFYRGHFTLGACGFRRRSMSIGLFAPAMVCQVLVVRDLRFRLCLTGSVPCGTTNFAPPAMLRTGVAWVAWPAGAGHRGHRGPEPDRLGRWNRPKSVDRRSGNGFGR